MTYPPFPIILLKFSQLSNSTPITPPELLRRSGFNPLYPIVLVWRIGSLLKNENPYDRARNSAPFTDPL
jgi:hypothetical protein